MGSTYLLPTKLMESEIGITGIGFLFWNEWVLISKLL